MNGTDSREDVSSSRSATDPEFLINFNTERERNRKVSNRTTGFLNDEYEYFNSLGITPDFGRHVAEILSKTLEGEIKVTKMKSSTTDEAERDDEAGGIRLFTSSRVNLELHEEVKQEQQKKPDLLKMSRKRKSRICEDSDTEDEESKFASVAVSSDWVLAGKGAY